MKRFWDKVKKTDKCWLWTATRTRSGYGAFGIGQRVLRAHRVAYALKKGLNPEDLPAEVVVRHTCDRRRRRWGRA